MKKLLNKTRTIGQLAVNWLLVALIAIISFKIPGDPDMGWHLRNGFDTIANWATQTGDTYSWTMSGYNWVSHEWLTEIIMAGVYSLSGLWGLALIFTALIAFTFWLASRAGNPATRNSLLLAIVGITIAWPLIGARPQMLTVLGVAVLLYILFAWRKHRTSLYLYSIPVLFLVWANMHAGFAAGFLLVGVFIVGEALRLIFVEKRKHKLEQVIPFRGLISLGLIAFLGGGLLTLVNPYGWNIYAEIVNTLRQPDILNQIMEWLPVDFTSRGSFNLIIGGLLVIGLMAVTKFKVDYTKLLIAVIFFFVALASWRHLPLFAVASLPFISEQVSAVSRSLHSEISRSFIALITLGTVVALAGWWHVTQSLPLMSDPSKYAEAFVFPEGAVEYIKTHDLGERMFNEYNWGGYLIWQLPEQKVFIDGRMAIWHEKDLRIFEEFSAIMSGKRQTILTALDKWKVDFVLVGNQKLLCSVLSLARDDWNIVYQDEISSIWVRQGTTEI